jgi:hypothetical protein
MKRLAGTANHPALTDQAQERRRATRREQRAAELAWEREHPGPVERDRFITEIAPRIAGMSARAISRASGLSVSYCAELKRGERVPHPRWWALFERVEAPRGGRNATAAPVPSRSAPRRSNRSLVE